MRSFTLMLCAGLACTTTENHYVTNNTYVTASDGGVTPDAELPTIALCEDPVPPVEFGLDLYGPVGGHTFVFNLTQEQADLMDQRIGNHGDAFGADQYFLGGGAETTYADLTVVDGTTGACSALGKIELVEVGQSSGRPWQQIPSLHADLCEFQVGLRLAGYEHLLLHNGQVGGIFREAATLRVWKALGYPAPKTNFVWVMSSAWGSDVRVPYTNVEMYKQEWCDRNAAALGGGGCSSVWEGAGDPAFGGFLECKIGECADDRLALLADRLATTLPGPGFMSATSDLIDWEAFQTFQCLSWFTATGDDYIHNGNNVVLVDRPDGTFLFLPYSTDISAGQAWYPVVDLPGWTTVPVGCQTDPECWSQLLDRCDTLVNEFEELNVARNIVDPVYESLEANGMLRAGDETRYHDVRTWYRNRPQAIRLALETYRDPCFDPAAAAFPFDQYGNPVEPTPCVVPGDGGVPLPPDGGN